MAPLAIVEQLDVFEDFTSCLGSGTPVALITQFEFERSKKNSLPPRYPSNCLYGSCCSETVRRQQLLILVAGVLAAAV